MAAAVILKIGTHLLLCKYMTNRPMCMKFHQRMPVILSTLSTQKSVKSSEFENLRIKAAATILKIETQLLFDCKCLSTAFMQTERPKRQVRKHNKAAYY
jgi:hypothetical protein